MDAISFTNRTGRKLTLIIEPIAEEYAFAPDEKIELRGQLYLDARKVVDLELTDELVIVYAPEEVEVTKDGIPVPRENS